MGGDRPARSFVLELIVALVLIALNGVFSLSELAVVSAREARLKTLAQEGRRGAATAIALAQNPGRFLSTVQIGITLTGIVAGAFSGAALGQHLSDFLMARGVAPAIADPMGFGIIIALITYLSVIVGELVPKQFALRNAEGIACAVAPTMLVVSRIGTPIVWLLDGSTRLVLRLLGVSTGPGSAVTEEEIKILVAEAENAGVIETEERRMISGVLRLGDRSVRAVMTPRMAVDWIDVSDSQDSIRRAIRETPHSRIPVVDGDPDNVIGVVEIRDLLMDAAEGRPIDLRLHTRAAPVVPDTLDALDVFGVLRQADVPVAIVHDEFGHFEGIVTPVNALEAIVGFKPSVGADENDAVQREDGSWLLSGSMPVDAMAEQLGVRMPEDRPYESVAGFVVHQMQRLPAVGESVTTHGWIFEVVDLDGRRVDKVLARRPRVPGGA